VVKPGRQVTGHISSPHANGAISSIVGMGLQRRAEISTAKTGDQFDIRR
jgi:hypothetical protein